MKLATCSVIASLLGGIGCGKTVDLEPGSAKSIDDPSAIIQVQGGTGLWVDTSHVYWRSVDSDRPDGLANRFSRCEKADCRATLASVEVGLSQEIGSVAVGNGQAFVSTPEDSRGGTRTAIRRFSAEPPGLDYVLTTSESSGGGLYAEPPFIYWPGEQGIYRCSSERCETPELWIREEGILQFWAAGGFFFWGGEQAEPGTFRRAPKDASLPPQSVVIDLGPRRAPSLCDFVSNGSTVFVSTLIGISSANPGDGEFDRIVATEFDRIVATKYGGPTEFQTSVEADTEHVYWLNAAGNAFRCEASGCVTPEPIPAIEHANHLALDDTHIWWITDDAIRNTPK